MQRNSQEPSDTDDDLDASDDWRSWHYQRWADELLRHYFGRREGDGGPVRALDVSDAELVRVTGDLLADPDEVRNCLETMTVRAAVSTRMPFWKHAEARMSFAIPFYLSHLMVACIAVSDATDADENSNIERIAEHTDGADGDEHLELLPTLWLALQAWLENHSAGYRPLVIPNPGGWTRIGHTFKLAFPSRRDRQKLAECLREESLDIEDPPIGPVVQAVGQRSVQFSQRFREEFDDFRSKRNAGMSLVGLHAMPFWSAVCSATRSEEGASTDEADRDWTLLAEDDGYEFELLLVTKRADSDVPTEELEDPFGDWTYVATTEAEQDPLDELLNGTESFGRLSVIVSGGVLPFREAAHGALELASRSELEEAGTALVADDLLDEVLSRFSGPRTRVASSPVGGWSLIRDLRIRVEEDDSLEGTLLARCWLLRPSPTPRRLTLLGGVRVGSAWLGLAPLLPKISAPGAREIDLERSVETVFLSHLDGVWVLPKLDFQGTAELVIRYEDETRRRELEFVDSPDSEVYRPPGRPDSWVLEGAARALRFSSWLDEYGDSPVELPDSVDRIYLGRDIGTFVSDASAGAWEVSKVGTHTVLRSLAPPPELIPVAGSENHGDRRRWRRLLSESTHDNLDIETSAVLRRAVSATSFDLPICSATPRTALSSASGDRTSPLLGLVVGALAAIFNRRQGLERRELTEILTKLLSIESRLARQVVRAWQECCILDELVNTRWSGRRFFAREPSIEVFEVAGEARATLRGLVLEATRSDIYESAERAGIGVSALRSFSPFVPASLTFHGVSTGRLREFAAKNRLQCRFVRQDPFQAIVGRDLRGAVPGGYVMGGAPVIVGDCVTLQNWRKPGSPSFWTIEDPQRRIWTHFYEAARFWASALADMQIVAMSGTHRLDYVNAYLPLSAARWVSAVGGPLPGPLGDGTGYVYGLPSRAMTKQVILGLTDFTSSELLDAMSRPGGN